MSHHLGKGKRSGFGIKATFDDLEIWRYASKIFPGGFIREVAQAEGLAYFAGGEQLFELDIISSLGAL